MAIASEPRGAMVNLSHINARLYPLSITADGLQRLGFSPAGKAKAAVLYDAADVPRIMERIARHVLSAAKTAAEMGDAA